MTTPDDLHDPGEHQPGTYDLDFKDFTLPEDQLKPRRFRIAPDVFIAPPFIAPVSLAALVGRARKLSAIGDLEQIGEAEILQLLEDIGDLMVELLDKESGSGERFKARMLATSNPIDLRRQVLPVIFWLVEVYGLRPTGPSSSSLIGSDGGGLTSTDGAQSEASPL